MGDEGEHEISLEFTPSWVMASVFAIFAIISFILQHIFLFFRKLFRGRSDGDGNNDNNQGGNNHNNQGDNNKDKPMLVTEAFKKIVEEFTVFGVVGFILYFCTNRIAKISITRCIFDNMLPCSLADRSKAEEKRHAHVHVHHKTTFCSRKNMVPLLSTETLHQIDLFIMLLGVMHIILSFIIIILGESRIKRLKKYNDGKSEDDIKKVMEENLVNFRGARDGRLFRLTVFCRYIYRSVTQSDYMTLKYGFCKAHGTFVTKQLYFHPYMIRANRDYFKQIVGISLYLWAFAVFFLLLNVHGLHAYFWIALIVIIALIFMGAILRHIVTQQALEISDDYTKGFHTLQYFPSLRPPHIPAEAKTFWFNCPDFVLQLIHFIIFQTAFEMTTFVWIWITYGFDSCMMGQLYYTFPRLFIGVCTLGLCGYSTLPLYAIVTEMGDAFNQERLDDIIEMGHIE